MIGFGSFSSGTAHGSLCNETNEKLSMCGTIRGHSNWVTSIQTCLNYPERLVTGSRDKTAMIWKLTFHGDAVTGEPLRRLTGHNHFISDLQLSIDTEFALTASWDKSVRLWDLKTGTSTRRLTGHTNDVLAVSFSHDNRQIVSGSRDKTLRLWNTLGDCKFVFGVAPGDPKHDDWVSCVRQTPNFDDKPLIVSASWDKTIQTWCLNTCTLSNKFSTHTNAVLCLDISPDGSLAASGGKDGKVCLYDLNAERALCCIPMGGYVNAIHFNPRRYWLAIAVSDTIVLLNLESRKPFEHVKAELVSAKATPTTISPEIVSLSWSQQDGNYLFSGHTDGVIRVWKVHTPSSSSG